MQQGASTQELLRVIQADRNAAAERLFSIFDGSPIVSTQDRIRAGEMDNHPWVQAFARHRIEHSTPDRNAVLFKRMAYFIECIAHADREGWNDATIAEARAIAALTTPEPTDPAGVSGLAEAEKLTIRRIQVVADAPCLPSPGGAHQQDLKDILALVNRLYTDLALASRTPSPLLEVAKEALEGLTSDEAASLRILEIAFADVGSKPPFFGEAYEPGVVIQSIVQQVATLQTIKGAGQ